MDYTAISDVLNVDLCAIESATLMLELANRQYRTAQQQNASEQVLKYFAEKNEVYRDYREELCSDVQTNYHSYKRQIETSYSQLKEELWEEFKKVYPNCTQSFDEVFNGSICTYPEFEKDCENLLNNKSNKIIGLYKTFLDYLKVAMDKQHLSNFKLLYDSIYESVDEFGSKPFYKKELSKGVVEVPIWAVEEIYDEVYNFVKDCKKETLQLNIKFAKLKNRFQKEPNNNELKEQINALFKEVNTLESVLENAENLKMEISHLYSRSVASTSKWKLGEVKGQWLELFKELQLGIPKNLRKLPVQKKTVLALDEEIERIKMYSKLYLNTFQAGSVLSLYAKKLTTIELFNFEYSKKVISSLSDTLCENEKVKQEIETSKEINEDEQSVLSEIKDCENALNYVQFETPLGVLQLTNGKLKNVKTGLVYDISVLSKFSLRDKDFVVTDSNKNIVEKISYDEVLKKLQTSGAQTEKTIK